MKTHKILFIFLLLPLFSSQCKKEGENCHYAIIFENNSSKKVYIGGFTLPNHNNECFFLDHSTIPPAESYKLESRYCWEHNIKYHDYDFTYLEHKTSTVREYFDCDSIDDYVTILKHIILTKDDLDDLRSTGFTINYP